MTDTERGAPAPSPTGEQWAIAHGSQTVVVTEVGATLRSFTVEGVDVVDGFGPDEWSHSGRGQVLAPWPNRLGDGRYEFAGVRAQAALDEPAHGIAIHGLVRWLPWQLEAHAQNRVALFCPVRPTPGYPFLIDLRLEYRLGRQGLQVTASASNPGRGAAPFGLGFHPYLRVGDGAVDTAVLSLPAGRRLVLDDRGLPTGESRPVAGTEYDFGVPRAIGPTTMDVPFTALRRDEEGRAWASLDEPATGRGVDLWVDGQYTYLMCFTGDSLVDPSRRRRAVAIEPMTCPPDALRTGRELIVLEPGQDWRGSWGLQPRAGGG